MATGGGGKKFERALRRFGRRIWDTPLICAMLWFLFGCIMLLFMIFSPLCISTKPCNIAQLTDKMVFTTFPDTEVPHGTSVSVSCSQPGLVPSHPVLECKDGTLEPIEKLMCQTTESARAAQLKASMAQEEDRKKNAACQINENEARTCPAVGTLKLSLPNTSRDFCYSYWRICMEVYPLLTGAEHDILTNECRIYCNPADPYKVCATLKDGQCQMNSNCNWDPVAKTCDSYAPKLEDESVPLGGFVSQFRGYTEAEKECFVAGPECMEMRGSCRDIDNGEYLRQTSCRNGRSYWEKREKDPNTGVAVRFIHWDAVATTAALVCAQGGRWILQQGSRPNGADTCNIVARQQSFNTVPEYDLGNPLALTDYDDVTRKQIKAAAARQRLQWSHLECTFGADVGDEPMYMRLVDCSCDRRFCTDRGDAVPNPEYPDRSDIRCICTCDEEKWGGPRCDTLRCIARTAEIANAHPEGVCQEGRYFTEGQFCTPRCADRFMPTDPGPFECMGDGSWEDRGKVFDCKMTFHECAAHKGIENAATPSCEEGETIKELEYCTPACVLGFEPSPPLPILCTRTGLEHSFECKRPCQQPYVINAQPTGACQKRRRIVGGQICRPDCQPGTWADPPTDIICQDDGQFPRGFMCNPDPPPADWEPPGTKQEVVFVEDPDAGIKHFIQVEPVNLADYRGNGTCPQGFTDYPDCRTRNRCQIVADIPNSADPPCDEGLVVAIQCTPNCKTGFQADTPLLVCRDNILYPPAFECLPEFAGTCEIMVYTSFGVCGLWVLVLLCLFCVAREKQIPRHINVRAEMDNFRPYASAVNPEDEEMKALTPKSKKQRLPGVPEDALFVDDDDYPPGKYPPGKGPRKKQAGEGGVFDFRSFKMKSRDLTSEEKRAIIDNKNPTDFFVPRSQLEEYMSRRAVLDSLAAGDDDDGTTQVSQASSFSMMSYASYDPSEGLKSPQGYPLQRFITPKSGYICDACDLTKPKGAVMFSAREESYDICNECVIKMAHGYGTPKDLAIQEDNRRARLAQEDPVEPSPHEKMLASAAKRKKEDQRVVTEKMRLT
ncbi:unnamed protein product [Amoebophrya sp. A25]|nr:unnamed protein product [Amoebophrya sp. A25]|eukprot:GSA25T00023179001.1